MNITNITPPIEFPVLVRVEENKQNKIEDRKRRERRKELVASAEAKLTDEEIIALAEEYRY